MYGLLDLNVNIVQPSLVDEECACCLGRAEAVPYLFALSEADDELVYELDCWLGPWDAGPGGGGVVNRKVLRNLHTASRG